MYGSMVGNTDTVKVLLQHGASLDLTDVHVRIYVACHYVYCVPEELNMSQVYVTLCLFCARIYILGISQLLHYFMLSLLVHRSLLVHSDLELRSQSPRRDAILPTFVT